MSQEPPPASPDDAQRQPGANAARHESAGDRPSDPGSTRQAPGQSDDYQALADALLGTFTAGRPPEEVALALAVLLNRAGARLHTLTRGQASAHKDQPEWPAWAQLQNASRTLVLHASTCRDLAARLAGRRK